MIIVLSLAVGISLSFAISILSSYAAQTMEVVIHKSPLIWRTPLDSERLTGQADGEGDYLLSKLASGGIYELTEEIETANQIETITVTWKSKGEVTLQVSVNNGQDYTPVVYGVPLDYRSQRTEAGGQTTEDRSQISGNRIKWRVTLGEDSELTGIKIVYTDISGAGGSFGEPELSGFKFRKSIYINRGQSLQETAPDLFNYQILVLVSQSTDTSVPGTEVGCGGKVRADFGDIRFTAADGETLLGHYLESITGDEPNRIAAYYVKLPQIPEQGLPIYMYYGNSQAEDLSSGEDVFDFFDDFKGEKLDAEKWEIYPELGSCGLLDSQLKLDAAKVISKAYRIKDGIIEYRATTGDEARAIIRDKKGAPELTQLAYSSAYKEVEHSIVVGDFVKVNTPQPILPGTSYDYRIIAKGENITFERYGTEDRGQRPKGVPSEVEGRTEGRKEVSVSYNDVGGLKRGSIGLKTGSNSVSYYDWLRVRKFAEPEPEITFSGKEELTNLARFSGTTLAKKGNLIKVSGDAKGSYISKVISTPFQTRIMIPTWSIEDYGLSTIDYGLKIDISADGGITYKTNCESGSYYYASRGDFTAGSNLRYRVRLSRSNGRSDTQDLGLEVEEVGADYRPGNILLVSPNGGESWQAGMRQKILWIASDYEPAYKMRIEYSFDGGKTYKMIKKRLKNTGVYFWSVPPKLSGKKIIIKVSNALDEKIYDISDGMLEIIE